MPRGLILGTTIVAAFQLHLAALSPLVEDAPLTPAVVEVALRFDMNPAEDRGRFIADLVRRMYSTADAKPPDVLLAPPPRTASPLTTFSVPVPLPASIWSQVIFRRIVPVDQLVTMILRDPRAAYLARGLSAVDGETLAYLSSHPELLRHVYENSATVFAGFADVLHVRDGRVLLPGGPRAIPLWDAALGTPTARPELAIKALFEARGGRLAYLASVIESAEPPAAQFALGFWIADDALRAARFKALADACENAYAEWKATEHPFYRPLGDVTLMLFRVRVNADGGPAVPNLRRFWSAALEAQPSGAAGEAGDAERIDAAWLVGATGGRDMYSRSERLDQLAFGGRLFAAPIARADETAALEIMRSYPHRRMLMLDLDRLGIRSFAVFSAALNGAEALESADAGRRFWSYAQYEGAFAAVTRMRRAGTLSAAQTETLLISLGNVRLRDGDYHGAIADWLRQRVAPLLPAGRDWEERLAIALGGPTSPARLPRITWEGQSYRLDQALSDRLRVEAVRRKQAGHTVDLAMAFDAAAVDLERQTLDAAAMRSSAATLRQIAERNASRLRHPPVNLMPPGVAPSRDALEWLTSIVRDLERAAASNDVRRGPRLAGQLRLLTDVVLGNALISLVYAVELGDPEGAALLAGNVALRHNFGFNRRDAEQRARAGWDLPRQDFQPGVPWHVSGSLIGLDIALAPLRLRRVAADRLSEAPRLSSIEREAIAIGVTLLSPARMLDADRDAIAEAIGRGRARMAAVAAGSEPADAVMEELGLDGWRRRALEWSLARDQASVPGQFSLVDLLVLGGGAPGADLDAWGTPGLYAYGCACPRFPRPRAWHALEGRYQLPTVAATMGDLNLAVAVMLHDLHLPAALARPVLETAARDFIDELPLTSVGEWWGLSRQAQALKRQRLEDYVAAAAAVDGPLVPEDDSLPPVLE